VNRDLLKTAVLFDRDSTLGNTRHRWPLSPMVDPSSSWPAYAAACADDPPMPGPVAAARLHYQHHRVHICSGMDGSAEQATLRWFDRHGIPYDEVRLRQAGDETTRNEDIKIAYILELRARGIETVLFYEDWGPAAEAIWERTGVPVVGINPFYPEDDFKLQQSKFDSVGGGL
jgi:hypothetical protein